MPSATAFANAYAPTCRSGVSVAGCGRITTVTTRIDGVRWIVFA